MSDRAEPARAATPVILFDGECGLCNRFVRLILRLDRRGVIRFAPLQGPPAQEFLKSRGLPSNEFHTVVFVSDWGNRIRAEFRIRTDAVIAALELAGGSGAFLATLLRILPREVRDAGYRFIARVRYHIFGAWRTCPLPRPEWKTRFLPDESDSP